MLSSLESSLSNFYGTNPPYIATHTRSTKSILPATAAPNTGIACASVISTTTQHAKNIINPTATARECNVPRVKFFIEFRRLTPTFLEAVFARDFILPALLWKSLCLIPNTSSCATGVNSFLTSLIKSLGFNPASLSSLTASCLFLIPFLRKKLNLLMIFFLSDTLKSVRSPSLIKIFST